MKDPDTGGDFYFDDELYTKRGKKCTRLYFDEETSVTSISESPVSSSLPMETVLKANSASSVEEKPGIKHIECSLFLLYLTYNSHVKPP